MWLCAALFVYQSFALHVNNIRVMVWSLTRCQLSARSNMGDTKQAAITDGVSGSGNLHRLPGSCCKHGKHENCIWISAPDEHRVFHFLLS